ncbi:MAG TPA: hypothetical protein VGB23_06300 [Nitrospirota bacterium]
MKRIVVALVSGVFVLSLVAGCGQKEEAVAPVEETPVATEAPAMENMSTAATEAPAEAPAEEAPAAH